MENTDETHKNETIWARLARVVLKPISDAMDAVFGFVFDVCDVALEILLEAIPDLIALAVTAFVGLGTVGLLWFGLTQLF